MHYRRIIAIVLTATMIWGGSLSAVATEPEEFQTLTNQESEQAELAGAESDDADVNQTMVTEPEESDDSIASDSRAESGEDAENLEASEDSDNSMGVPVGNPSDMKEIAEIDPQLIGSIVESDSGIQTLASYNSFSYTYNYESVSFSSSGGHTASEILNKAVDIIVANEGSYDSVDPNDNNSGAMSIGKIQWWADSALTLARLIVAEDNATAYNLLGESLYNEIIDDSTSWKQRTLSSSETTKMQAFLNPDKNPASKTIQDKLAKSYLAVYINHGYGLGIRNAAALVYYADIENQYGYSGGNMGAAKACAEYAYNIAESWDNVTLNELHLAAISNVAHNYTSSSGQKGYINRRRSTYGKLATCGWTYCNSGDHTIPYDENGYAGAAWLKGALNYYQNAGLTVDNNYDDALKSAVKSYQKKIGATQDGLAGSKTSTKLIHDMYYTSMQTKGAAPKIGWSGTDIVKINGKWVYQVNGVTDYTYTGVAKNSNGWWYVKNGVVDFTYNGFATNSNGKWYCEDGKVTFNKNSVIKDTTGAIGTKGTWWYVVGSKVQTSFTGLADYKNSNGWWYIKNGQVDFSANTVAKNKNGWWYITGGKVDFTYNGFATNSNGKWYCEDGKVTFNKNSVIKDTKGAIGTKGTWWYVVGSKVQTSFTGLADYKNSNGWWYIKNGQVDFSANTVAKNKNGWWYVTSGKVQFGFTGLANYKNANGWWYIKGGKVDFTANTVAKNKNGWWYVKDGKVQFSYNGFASNSNGKWYIEGGEVTFKKNSVIKDTTGAIGTKGTWYYVVGSKVQTGFTGLADYKNSYGWWYIKNGKVDFTANTVAKNKNGWWYVNEGKVDFGFNGIAQNKNGWWYIKGGQVDFSYNGTVTTADGTKYSVTNGKVNR